MLEHDGLNSIPAKYIPKIYIAALTPPRRNLLDGEIDTPNLFLPRMASHNDGFHPLAQRVRIYLRRRNIGTTERLLNG